MGTYVAVGASTRAVRDAQRDARAVAELVAGDHHDLIERSRHLLGALSLIPEIRERRGPECARLFAELLREYGSYTALGATDAAGTVVCSAPGAGPGGTLRDRPIFLRLKAAPAFTVGEYSIGRFSGKPSLGLAQPLFSKEGRFSGVLFAALDTGWLAKMLATPRVPSGVTVTVLDRKGVVLARLPASDGWVGKSARESPAMAPALGGDVSARDAIGLDGRRRLFSFVRMTSGDIVVAVGVDYQIATAAMYRALVQIVAISLGFLGLVLGAAWLGTTALVLRPLRRLLTATRRFTAGDLEARVGVAPRTAELGELAEAFDNMAESLQRRTRQAEQAEHSYRGLFERNLAGMFRKQTGRLLECNPAFARILGYDSPTDVMSHPVAVLYADRADRDRLLADLAVGAPLTREVRLRRKDGVEVWVLLQVAEVRTSEATFSEGMIIDVTDRREREVAYREATSQRELGALAEAAAHSATKRAERTFRALLESGPDAIVIANSAGRMVLVNAQTETLFGYTKDELVDQSIEMLVPSRFRDRHGPPRPGYFHDPRVRASSDGFDLYGLRKDGSEFPLEISSSPLETEDGTMVSSAIRDVTAAKTSRDKLRSSLGEKEVLLKEIHHRVKNNMQVVSSLLSLQAGSARDPRLRASLAQSQFRVQAMALVHETLYQSDNLAGLDFSKFANKLWTSLTQTFGKEGAGARFHAGVDAPPLDIDQAVPCALILAELLSNTIKHAFAERRDGSVSVGLHAVPGEDGRLRMEVGDDGVGLGEEERPGTAGDGAIGLKIIEALGRQLGATQVWSGPGTRFTMTFAMSRHADRQGATV